MALPTFWTEDHRTELYEKLLAFLEQNIGAPSPPTPE